MELCKNVTKEILCNGKNIIFFERHISSESLTIIVSWLDEDWMLCVLCYHIIHAIPDRLGIPVLHLNIY